MKETLRQYVDRIMRQKGLNAADVERKCNSQISASYVGRITRGVVTNLTVEKIVGLAQGLEVDPFEIFAASCGTPPTAQASSDVLALLDLMQKLVMNPEVLEAVEQLLNMSPKERDVLLQPIKGVNNRKNKGKKEEN